MAANNSLQFIEAYLSQAALPLLVNMLTICRTFDHKYDNWDTVEKYGTRGATYKFKKPTRISTSPSLSFDAVNTGEFAEEFMTISADQQSLANYAVTDQQLATFNNEDLLRTNGDASIESIATDIDTFCGTLAAFGGYRFVGAPIVQPGQMQSVGEVTEAMALVRSFGGNQLAYYGIPNIEYAAIGQTALQQFVPERNEELSFAGDLGHLGGVSRTRFYQSTLFPIHLSGTAANNTVNTAGGYEITSVTPATVPSTSNTSVIVLTGGTTGETILVNDVFDIGAINLTNPVNFLTFVGYAPSRVQVQGKVLVGDTFDGGGNATITVQPAYIFDGTGVNPARNLSRAIITGASGDLLRLATSHVAGEIHMKNYIKFANPMLPTKSPYDTATEGDPETQTSLRVYHGALMGNDITQFVHDTIFGGGAAEEGVVRVLYPLTNST